MQPLRLVSMDEGVETNRFDLVFNLYPKRLFHDRLNANGNARHISPFEVSPIQTE